MPMLSDIPEVVWPAVPSQVLTRHLAVQYQFEQNQWLPADRLLDAQLEQLAPLLQHCLRTVPAYGPRLQALVSGPLTLQSFRRVPLLQRSDLQRDRQGLRSTAPPTHHGPLVPSMTSGSTGRPVEVLHSEWHRIQWIAFTMRQHRWFGRDLGEPYATIRFFHDPAHAAAPAGLRVDHWSGEVGRQLGTGPGYILNLATPVPAQAEWLRRVGPKHLQTFPTNLYALARQFLDEGSPLEGLVSVNTLSETVTADLRALCRDAFGVGIRDTYSSQEVGYMALECPSGGYHVQAENVLLEVLDAAGRPCGPGEVGRVVITALHNWASPMIRYENGDHAEVGEPCPCGRGLPNLKRILGRTRNRFKTPDGGGFWPAYSSKDLLQLAPYEQMQLVQTSLERVEVRLVAPVPLTDDHFEALRTELLRTLAWPFELGFQQVPDIPRSQSGKFEDCICLVP